MKKKSVFCMAIIAVMVIFTGSVFAGGNAILKADKNNDKKADAGERNKYFSNSFKKMDSDKSGGLTLKEYQTGRMKVFKDRDTNKDGVVVLSEYVEFPEKTDMKKFKAKCKKCKEVTPDSNADGIVEEEEFLIFRCNYFNEKDKNHDGKVTMKENKKHVTKRFKKIDKNKDGKIDKKELFDFMKVK